ncbi:MAG: hypothetical protein GY845_27540 [Planctomycetes bacterium]|nr:hypothetical protein [Planctomycetota bacterium]
MAIKFCCPKCDKVFSVKKEHAGRKAKCPCGAIIVVPGHKKSRAITYIVDEKHSQPPFFIVYRIAWTSALESSIRQAMATKSEIILAKLFVTAPMLQQLIFTNRRIIVLRVISSCWDRWWRRLEMLGHIPVIGWAMEIFLTLIRYPVFRLFKIDYRHVYRLNAVANEEILSVGELPKNFDKKIIAGSLLYTAIVQPSLGITIRRRWLAFGLTKIRGTTLRFIPVGRLRSAVTRFLDVADYLLPNQLNVDKLAPVLRAFKPHLPSTEIDLTEKKHSVSFRWPSDIGIGDTLWSVRRAKILTIVLAAITLFFFVSAIGRLFCEEEYLLLFAALFAYMTYETLLVRRFAEAIIKVIVVALFFTLTFIQILVEDI